MIDYKEIILAVERSMVLFSGLVTDAEKAEWMERQMKLGSALMNSSPEKGSYDEKRAIARDGHRTLDKSFALLASMPDLRRSVIKDMRNRRKEEKNTDAEHV